MFAIDPLKITSKYLQYKIVIYFFKKYMYRDYHETPAR